MSQGRMSTTQGLDLTLPDASQKSRSMKLGKVLPHVALPTTLSVAELGPSAVKALLELLGVGVELGGDCERAILEVWSDVLEQQVSPWSQRH